jgi:uncharacterized phosphosugar-binding protein
MKLATRYHKTVLEQLRRIFDTQRENIEQAAGWFADCLCDEKWIYLFGSGHSHVFAEELFYRAGGLARIVPMLYEPIMLHRGAADSTRLERDLSLVPTLLEQYQVGARDVFVVISNSGRNPVPIELAVQARGRGARVIALVNRRQTEEWPSRHPSGQNLPAVADLVLDNCGAVGDACVRVAELGGAFGPTSTVAGTVILQMIACAAVEQTLARGCRPEVFVSSNTTGDEANRAILQKYRGRIPHL